MPRKLPTLLLCMLAVAVLAGGCGSQDDAEGGDSMIASSSLSKRQFTQKVIALCREGREELPKHIAAFQRENPPGDSPPAQYRAAGVQATILPLLEDEIAAIRELGAPAGDEQRVDAMLVAQQEAVDEIAELESLDPTEGVMESYFDEASQAMREYGIAECTVK